MCAADLPKVAGCYVWTCVPYMCCGFHIAISIVAATVSQPRDDMQTWVQRLESTIVSRSVLTSVP